MVDMRLYAIRQVNGKNAILELVDQIERPWTVDLVMRRVTMSVSCCSIGMSY
jgi:hypothetical protein